MRTCVRRGGLHVHDLQLCAQFLQLRVRLRDAVRRLGPRRRGTIVQQGATNGDGARGTGELTKVNRYFHFLKRSLHSTTSTHSIHFSLHASRSTHWVDGVPSSLRRRRGIDVVAQTRDGGTPSLAGVGRRAQHPLHGAAWSEREGRSEITDCLSDSTLYPIPVGENSSPRFKTVSSWSQNQAHDTWPVLVKILPLTCRAAQEVPAPVGRRYHIGT